MYVPWDPALKVKLSSRKKKKKEEGHDRFVDHALTTMRAAYELGLTLQHEESHSQVRLEEANITPIIPHFDSSQSSESSFAPRESGSDSAQSSGKLPKQPGKFKRLPLVKSVSAKIEAGPAKAMEAESWGVSTSNDDDEKAKNDLVALGKSQERASVLEEIDDYRVVTLGSIQGDMRSVSGSHVNEAGGSLVAETASSMESRLAQEESIANEWDRFGQNKDENEKQAVQSNASTLAVLGDPSIIEANADVSLGASEGPFALQASDTVVAGEPTGVESYITADVKAETTAEDGAQAKREHNVRATGDRSMEADVQLKHELNLKIAEAEAALGESADDFLLEHGSAETLTSN
jgi:hypothetical protein